MKEVADMEWFEDVPLNTLFTLPMRSIRSRGEILFFCILMKVTATDAVVVWDPTLLVRDTLVLIGPGRRVVRITASEGACP